MVIVHDGLLPDTQPTKRSFVVKRAEQRPYVWLAPLDVVVEHTDHRAQPSTSGSGCTEYPDQVGGVNNAMWLRSVRRTLS
jgi:hypothetical protein